jgi:glucose/arabinose dehydrogenase
MHLLSVGLGLFAVCASALAQVPFLQAVEFVGGLNRPIDVASCGDGQLYVAEMGGNIRIIDQNGQLISTPFLSIPHLLFDTQWNGVFGLAFHPAYLSNGSFFIKYIGRNNHLIVSRFQRDVNNPSYCDPATEQIIFSMSYTGGHQGGDIAFGPDGYLYIPTGDGDTGGRGEVGDPGHVAQNLSSLRGKIVRIDVNQGNPYGIPPDNPYQQIGDDIPDELWAVGLRNPWRISFDKTTGEGWLGDNGQDGWEEIHYFPAGSPGALNFGWSCYEGTQPYKDCGSGIDFVAPVYVYSGYNNNGQKNASVVGGYVYRGENYPALQGWYFFSDYSSGNLHGIRRVSGGTVDHFVVESLFQNPVTFGEGSDGELYVATFFEGKIYRLKSPMIESRQSGDWDQLSSWTCTCLPTLNDPVRISTSHTLTLKSFNGQAECLHLMGNLDLDTNATLRLGDQ